MDVALDRDSEAMASRWLYRAIYPLVVSYNALSNAGVARNEEMHVAVERVAVSVFLLQGTRRFAYPDVAYSTGSVGRYAFIDFGYTVGSNRHVGVSVSLDARVFPQQAISRIIAPSGR
eukprot:11206179-Lingulodinium_polyedra.AAC.1